MDAYELQKKLEELGVTDWVAMNSDFLVLRNEPFPVVGWSTTNVYLPVNDRFCSNSGAEFIKKDGYLDSSIDWDCDHIRGDKND